MPFDASGIVQCAAQHREPYLTGGRVLDGRDPPKVVRPPQNPLPPLGQKHVITIPNERKLKWDCAPLVQSRAQKKRQQQ
eukprot:scaffold199993_cov21-Tisochrysis_lutea.AAC.1